MGQLMEHWLKFLLLLVNDEMNNEFYRNGVLYVMLVIHFI